MVIAYSSKSSFERNPQVSQSGNSGKYQAARSSYMDTLQASIERREKRRREEEEAKRKAELQAQQEGAQERRDERQHKYGQSDTNQRAGIASAAADQDFLNTSQLNRQQQAGLLKRDDRQNQFMTGRDLQQAIDVQNRDKRQFGYSRMDSEQKFGQQLQRDELQQGYTLDRDASQNGMQAERDQRLNQFDSQRTQGQNQFQLERDAKQQGYSQQDAARRETAEISAKWNDQIQQARSQGLDFSEAQKQKLNELDRVFRENVMGNDELDEGLRQQAMLLHQKKVSRIIPDEVVKSPQDIYQQKRIFDEELGMYFLQGQDAKGNPTFEHIAGRGGGFAEQQRMREKEQQRTDKQMDVTRKAEFDREERWQKTLDDVRNTLVNDEPVFTDPVLMEKEAMRRFERTDNLYRDKYGLEPFEPYKRQAEEIRKSQIPVQQQPARNNPYSRENRKDYVPQGPVDPLGIRQSQFPSGPQQSQLPVRPNAPRIIPAEKGADPNANPETAKVLEMVNHITNKWPNGVPSGSQDHQDLFKAYKFLKEQGLKFDLKPAKPKAPKQLESPYGGDFYAF